MRKFVILLAVLLVIQIPVSAEIKDVTYRFDEEYTQTLDTGLEYGGYSGKLDFTVADKDVDEVGIILAVNRLYHVPFKIPFVGDLASENFSVRIGGRGLVYGDYTATPYYVKDGVTTYGEQLKFNISESCVAMTNLRIAYDQINALTEKGIFNQEEQKIVDYIMAVAKDVIEDGENGIEITKEYVRANYKTETETAKSMYDNLGSSLTRIKFAGKFNPPNVDKIARVYLMTEFELMKFI